MEEKALIPISSSIPISKIRFSSPVHPVLAAKVLALISSIPVSSIPVSSLPIGNPSILARAKVTAKGRAKAPSSSTHPHQKIAPRVDTIIQDISGGVRNALSGSTSSTIRLRSHRSNKPSSRSTLISHRSSLILSAHLRSFLLRLSPPLVTFHLRRRFHWQLRESTSKPT